MHDHERFLTQAIELARQARAAGNHPFGALLVVDGRVALMAVNTVVTDRNPTAHAEHNLVLAAIQQLPLDEIARGILYTSCEPCAMCAGAMYWAGVRDVVYGLPAEALARLAGGRFVVPCRDLFGRASDIVRVTGPLLLEDALAVHEGFWPTAVR